MEAVGYVLVYFAKGRLPWQPGLKAKSAHKKYKLILDKKQEISIAQLCHGCPAQFAEYLSYCRSLKFDASPNVAYLRRLFRLYSTSGHDVAQIAANDWDWMANADVRVDATTAQAYGARPTRAQARRPRPPPGARPARPQSASAQRPANEEQFYAPPGRSASRGYDYGGDRHARRPAATATGAGRARRDSSGVGRARLARGARATGAARAAPARRGSAVLPTKTGRAPPRSGGRGAATTARAVAGARSMMGLARARSARSAGGGRAAADARAGCVEAHTRAFAICPAPRTDAMQLTHTDLAAGYAVLPERPAQGNRPSSSKGRVVAGMGSSTHSRKRRPCVAFPARR